MAIKSKDYLTFNQNIEIVSDSTDSDAWSVVETEDAKATSSGKSETNLSTDYS